jgi:hypothetical protein
VYAAFFFETTEAGDVGKTDKKNKSQFAEMREGLGRSREGPPTEEINPVPDILPISTG